MVAYTQYRHSGHFFHSGDESEDADYVKAGQTLDAVGRSHLYLIDLPSGRRHRLTYGDMVLHMQGCAIILCFFLFTDKLIAAPTVPSIPSIARIGNITTGSTTIEQLVRRFGSGRYIPGGHPTGGRSWHLKNARVLVTADGFYYNTAGGRIVDSLTVDAEHDKTPRGNHKRDGGFTFMGVIHLGMKKEAALTLLKDKLPSQTPIGFKRLSLM